MEALKIVLNEWGPVLFYLTLICLDYLLAFKASNILQNISNRERMKSPSDRSKLLKPVWEKIDDEFSVRTRKPLSVSIILLGIAARCALCIMQIMPINIPVIRVPNWPEITVAGTSDSDDSAESTVDNNSDSEPELPSFPEYMTEKDIFIFNYIEDASLREFSDEELYLISKDDLGLIRNGVYAKHGRIFLEEYLSDYYLTHTPPGWYKPCIKPDCFSYSVFNSYEQHNILRLRYIQLEY